MATDAPISIKKSSLLPYWFFATATVLFGLTSWVARGISFWLWLAAGMVGAGVLLALLLRIRSSAESQSKDWYRNLQRFFGVCVLAGLGGFAIRFFFASAVVFIDNETPMEVRLVLDGNNWASVPAHGQIRRSLTKGLHTLEVYAADGKPKLDEHPIDVAGCGKYVLNVLGAQIYFQGEIVYGPATEEPPAPKMIVDKWFECEPVDYLFTDPPPTMLIRFEKSLGALPSRKTYLLRGSPPVFKK